MARMCPYYCYTHVFGFGYNHRYGLFHGDSLHGIVGIDYGRSWSFSFDSWWSCLVMFRHSFANQLDDALIIASQLSIHKHV